MKGRCALGPEQQQAVEGLGPIQCNPANAGVGWLYPAQAAIHFRNVLLLPGRTAAAHLYGLIGFGEKFSYDIQVQTAQQTSRGTMAQLNQGQVQSHNLYNAMQYF